MSIAIVCSTSSCDGSRATPTSDVVEDHAAIVRLHAEQSLALERSGDIEGAMREASAAIAAGGGRDATLNAARLAIVANDLDRAQVWLEPLVAANEKDAIAQYDLALVFQHRRDYNRARNGYLAALAADPAHADARYNLAILCHERGIHEEARHHAAKFRERFPGDPRGPALDRLTGGSGAAGPSGPDVAPSKP